MASAPTAAALDEEKRQRFHEQSGSRELPSVLPKDAHLEGGHVVANDKGSDSDIITEERAAKAGSIETRPTWTFSGFYKRYNVFFDIFFVAVILGWWISGLIIRPSSPLPLLSFSLSNQCNRLLDHHYNLVLVLHWPLLLQICAIIYVRSTHWPSVASWSRKTLLPSIVLYTTRHRLALPARSHLRQRLRFPSCRCWI